MRIRYCHKCSRELEEDTSVLYCDRCFNAEYSETNFETAAPGLKVVYKSYRTIRQFNSTKTISKERLRQLELRSIRLVKGMEDCSKIYSYCTECKSRPLCVTMFDRIC